MTPEGRALGLAYGVVGAFALVGMACVASWWEPSVPVDRWPPPALTYVSGSVPDVRHGPCAAGTP